MGHDQFEEEATARYQREQELRAAWRHFRGTKAVQRLIRRGKLPSSNPAPASFQIPKGGSCASSRD